MLSEKNVDFSLRNLLRERRDFFPKRHLSDNRFTNVWWFTIIYASRVSWLVSNLSFSLSHSEMVLDFYYGIFLGEIVRILVFSWNELLQFLLDLILMIMRLCHFKWFWPAKYFVLLTLIMSIQKWLQWCSKKMFTQFINFKRLE